MNDKIEIKSWSEFKELEDAGLAPLINSDYIIDIFLRIEIHNNLFGKSALGKFDIVKTNNKFYKYVWSKKPHICEESGIELNYYSASFISHILTRGAHPEMSHDIRNINILTKHYHGQWETGNRKAMRIYLKNLAIVDQLREDYNKLQIKSYAYQNK